MKSISKRERRREEVWNGWGVGRWEAGGERWEVGGGEVGRSEGRGDGLRGWRGRNSVTSGPARSVVLVLLLLGRSPIVAGICRDVIVGGSNPPMTVPPTPSPFPIFPTPCPPRTEPYKYNQYSTVPYSPVRTIPSTGRNDRTILYGTSTTSTANTVLYSIRRYRSKLPHT